jgi:hypothetical protein
MHPASNQQSMTSGTRRIAKPQSEHGNSTRSIHGEWPSTYEVGRDLGLAFAAVRVLI